MKAHRTTHPLEHLESFRAVISAAPPLAELARELRDRQVNGDQLVGTLALACGDLVHGFSLPQGSRMRREAHGRAWNAMREIDRCIVAARINKLAPARVIKRAQRAIDRADVLVGALVGQ